MFSKTERNYFLDILLGLIGFACAATGLILKFRLPVFAAGPFAFNLKAVHEITGYLVILLAIAHLLMHSKWLKSVTQNVIIHPRKIAAMILSILIAAGICLAVAKLEPVQRRPDFDQSFQNFRPRSAGHDSSLRQAD